MRKTHLIIAAVTLITVSCKKQPTELNSVDAPVTEAQVNNISNPCYGNNWANAGAFTPGAFVLTLTYNNKLYVFDNPDYVDSDKDLHIYDGTSWQTIYSDIPVVTNHPRAFAFIINNKGYLGKSGSSSLYQYDFVTNTFTPKTGCPGIHSGQEGVATFAIGNRGYMMGGSYTINGTKYHSNETWEYNPVLDSWTKKANFGFLGMQRATGFCIGGKGYLVNGMIEIPNANDYYFNSLLEYNPWTDSWESKAPFPGTPRIYTNTFVIGDYGYAGGGGRQAPMSWVDYNDFYKYNPATDQWTQIPNLPFGKTLFNSFTLNSKGYVVSDLQVGGVDLIKYTPRTCPPVVGPGQ
jgi:N-acetylneuraminic acid mutarotase